MLSDTERVHICKLLNIDETTFSNTAGFVFDRDREVCTSCGKYSGHDDLVDTALKMKVHSPEFILDGLLTGKPSPVAHPINCSACGKKHQATFRWPGLW
ncbi:hypothetical protein CGCSCA5_v006772 [Colletotrichum siamense]|nr:hypothetical protein CGCSCA5_v006772 [Colletotrichum siamense]KAF4870341.1 hypothetical protein CGCSCA1_v010422 [Colletotrichum siamense]